MKRGGSTSMATLLALSNDALPEEQFIVPSLTSRTSDVCRLHVSVEASNTVPRTAMTDVRGGWVLGRPHQADARHAAPR